MGGLKWSESAWDRWQRVALWFLGAAGIVNELFIQSEPRPMAYPIIAGLLGLPFAKAFDRARIESKPPASAGPSQSDPGARL